MHINCRNSPKIGRGNINTDRLVPYVPASQEANESQKEGWHIGTFYYIIRKSVIFCFSGKWEGCGEGSEEN